MTSDDQTTLVVTEVMTLAKINRQKQDFFCELPVLQVPFPNRFGACPHFVMFALTKYVSTHTPTVNVGF
jgi:hypothetical protein